MDRGLPEGPISVMMLKTLGKKEWGRMMGYGRLWATETASSPSQRLYGEYCMAKSMEIISKGLMAKAYLYMIINPQN
jgi:hypothetical protein